MIDMALVHQLVESQFSKWKDLPIYPVEPSGWDNKTFRLGEDMLIRMPSSKEYATQVEKEQKWLPKLAPFLPLSIPEPLALGEPSHGYPWKWSIYRWIEGVSAAAAPADDLCDFAFALAKFLMSLQGIDPAGGPMPGPHSFYRGGLLKVYDSGTRRAIASLKGKIDVDAVNRVWEEGLLSPYKGSPVWVHGDISVGNLLIKEGRLSSVIDFGQLTVGDPACDLVIAWTLFKEESREVFQKTLSYDKGTWNRARAWALWKALIAAEGSINSGNVESKQCWHIINEVVNSL